MQGSGAQPVGHLCTLQRNTVTIDPNRDQLTSMLCCHTRTPPAARVTTHLALSFIEFKKTRTLLSVARPSCGSETVHLHLICALLAFGLLDTCRPAKPCQRAVELLWWHSRTRSDKAQTCVGAQCLPNTPQRVLLDPTAVDIHQLPMLVVDAKSNGYSSCGTLAKSTLVCQDLKTSKHDSKFMQTDHVHACKRRWCLGCQRTHLSITSGKQCPAQTPCFRKAMQGHSE